MTHSVRSVLAGAALPAAVALSLAVTAGAGGLGDASAGRPSGATARSTQAAAEPHFPVDGGFAFTGHGYGHGHGMSQYGAYGAALRGLSAAQILSFYYPGTAPAAAGNPTVRVRLSTGAANSATVLDPARDGALTVTDHAGAGRAMALPTTVSGTGVSGWRAVPAGGGRLALQGYWAGGWRAYPTTSPWTTAGALSFASSSGVVALQGADLAQRDYRGVIEGVPSGAGVLTLDLVPRESYLRSVVPSEMTPSWSAAALQAQAVAARTYEAATAGGSTYDICDYDACQAYSGVASYTTGGALRQTYETPSTDAAIAATAGQLRTSAGVPIFAQFGSADGGWTAAGGESYLPAEADPYDGVVASSAHSWTQTVSAGAVGAATQVGVATELVVNGRDGHGDWGGRTTSVTVRGTTGTVTLSGPAFAGRLGLRSEWWTAPAGPPPPPPPPPAYPPATAVDLYGIEDQGGASGAVEVHAVSAASGYQAFSAHRATALSARSSTDWRMSVGPYAGDGAPDLWAVCVRHCGSGHIEVHVLSAASGYRTFLLHTATVQPELAAPAAATVRIGSYNRDGAPDLALVLAAGTGSGRVEVHVLSAASRWQNYLTHRATALPESAVNPAQWTFLVGDAAGDGDLVAIHDAGATGSGRTEAHVLSQASGYQSWTAHDATALALGSGASFALGNPAGHVSDDLYVLLGTGTGSGHAEVHVLSGATRYAAFTEHRATPLPLTPPASWTLGLG